MNRQRVRSLSAIVLMALMAVAGCAAPESSAASRAAAWLVATHQNDDGGYSSFSAGANQAPSDAIGTLDALPAIAAGGGDTAPLLAYLSANGAALAAVAAEDGGQTGKMVLALIAAGADPTAFAGQDLLGLLEGHLGESGAFGVEDAYKQSLAVLALSAAGQAVPEPAMAWLESRQAENGSWDDGFGTTDNPDATALAVMALLAAGRTAGDPTVAAAVDFLAGAQASEGGWAYGPGLPPSANSTALVIQAIIALGEDPTAVEGRWAKAGRSPQESLLAFQGESGAFQADFGDGPFDDFFSTVQAVPAAAGRALPPALAAD